MTLFELVKIALDEMYAEGKAQLGSKVDARIKEQMAYLSDSYGKLNQADREKVSYRHPATRFAYAYKYVATHGDYIVQILEELSEVDPFVRTTVAGILIGSVAVPFF